MWLLCAKCVYALCTSNSYMVSKSSDQVCSCSVAAFKCFIHAVSPSSDTELCSLSFDQQAGLTGENPLAALPVQQGVHLLRDLPQGLASAGSSRSSSRLDAFCPPYDLQHL